MNVKQRVLAARLAEKSNQNRDYLKELGIVIYYEEDIEKKGERKNGKE